MTRRKFALAATEALASVRALCAADPDYTLVVVPDTQYLSNYCNAAMYGMMRWVVNNLNASQGGVFTTNIKAVIGVGDVTNNADPGQYSAAQTAYSYLDGANIPWICCPGNHDYASSGTRSIGSGFQTGGYFASDYRHAHGAYGALPTGGGASLWGGSYDNANYYIKLLVGGRRILIFSLE